MLSEHSLVVHLHLPVPDSAGDPASLGLIRTWETCRTRLGMDRPAVATALPDELPAEPGELPASGGVAACRSRNAEAILQRRDDLLFLSVALTGTGDTAERWPHLERHWTDAVGDTGDWLIGETRLFVAYSDIEPRTADVPPEVLGVLTATARGRQPGRLPPATWVAGPEAVLWEMPGTAIRPLRRIVAITRDEERTVRDLERWLWSETTNRPARFARYLGHAAKVRHQLRLLSTATDPPDLGASIDGALAVLESARTTSAPDASAAEDSTTRTSAEPLSALETAHGRLLTDLNGTDGVVRRIFELKNMRRTVEIAAANIRLESPVIHSVGEHESGLFTDDQEVARWSAHRLDDSIAFLELDRDYARDVVEILRARIDTTVQRRREALQERETAVRRWQNYINLLQTALLSAVIMILTAIQAFDYRPRFLPRSAVPAVIATLGALALFLATRALSSVNMGRRRFVWPDLLFAGLFASTAGWLTATLIVRFATGHPSPASLTWAVMTAAFLACCALRYTKSGKHPRKDR